MPRSSLPISFLLLLLCLPQVSLARGGGGCLLPGTLVATPQGPVSIEQLRPGDQVLGFTTDRRVVVSVVRNILSHGSEEHLLIRTNKVLIRATPEHPFLAGSGAFKTAGLLAPGDVLRSFDGANWSDEPIVSIDHAPGPVAVIDLQTDSPHTFFAENIAVHNKGGGCFVAGTQIMTPAGPKTIETIARGDEVLAFTEDGRLSPVKVQETYATTSQVLVVRTRHGMLFTTEEHPLRFIDGGYLPASEALYGGRLTVWRKGLAKRAAVLDAYPLSGEEEVYNLTVDEPHTFIADGFVAHNKGGGGGGFRGGGSYRGGSSSGRPMSDQEFKWFLIMVGGFTGAAVIIFAFERPLKRAFPAMRRFYGQNLDQLFSRAEIRRKSLKTERLLEFIGRQDPGCDPQVLAERATSTFRLLQQCWEKREYGPMQPLLMPDLYADHLRQIEGMRRNHEINLIEGLTIDAVDLVNVRYPQNIHEREFSALITATAQDHYIDDRTRARRRGDEAPAQFQEVWTFHLKENQWLLREIEQTAESDVLQEENYFEQFTDKAVDQVYGETAGAEGPSGPWAEEGFLSRERRIERLLNHLVRTDRLWMRNRMLQTSRSVFIGLMTSREAGVIEAGLSSRLAPELEMHLAEELEKNRKEGIVYEYRNLAVRKAELVLVRNFADKRRNEFLVRIRAHAQKVLKRNNEVVLRDGEVTAFEQYLTFGRIDDDWKLKEIVGDGKARELAGGENVVEGATPQMIAWLYQHKRAL